MSEPTDITELRKNVHKGLGRALLRFQHLEQVLKKLVGNRIVAGPPGESSNAIERRRDEVMLSPLGWLKEELLAKLLRPLGTEDDDAELDKAGKRGHIAVRIQISVQPEEHAQLVHHLTVVHERRNKVVHHFLDAFDLQTTESCKDGIAFLEETHDLLDAHLGQLIEFAKWAFEAKAEMGKVLLEQDFPTMLTNALEASAKPKPKAKPKSPKRRGPKNSGGRPSPT